MTWGKTYDSEQYKYVVLAGRNCFSQVMLRYSSAGFTDMHPTLGSPDLTAFCPPHREESRKQGKTAFDEASSNSDLPELWEHLPAIPSAIFIFMLPFSVTSVARVSRAGFLYILRGCSAT